MRRPFAAGGVASRYLASTLVLATVVAGISGCSEKTSCSRGSSTVETAVRTFLVAVQNGNRAAAESQLVYNMEVSDQELEQLRQGLTGVDVGSVFVSVSRDTATSYQISVTRQDGTFVGRYVALETKDQAPGCFGMNEGHASAPDPGAKVSPSAATIAP